MDEISSRDALYRKEMERGSKSLLEAIQWARKGHNPATRTEPLKLPPDYSNRTASQYDEAPNRDRLVPCSERVREMMERDMTAHEIAAVLKKSRQKVASVMKKIKLQRRSDRQAEMIRKGMWG